MIYLFPVLGYLLGSIPSALWVTRLVKGVDVREGGSGHVTTTNTIRQAGWGWGVLVFVMDVSKGYLPVYLALRAGAPAWLIALTAAAAVIGHCWPLYAGFRGGMGLACAGGAFLAVYPLAFAIALALLLALTLSIHHSARASVFAGLLVTPVLYLLGLRGTILWVAPAVGAVIAVRFLDDWNRQYRELWLDREQS
ncbi:MAG: glycerol-3-phosphate acyltransferase [Anaerolineae bacterium]|nr:MAG: glycerol-3-phosphate acyltransferase [Anaerolineae bacterium]